MIISARAEYAVRALLVLTASQHAGEGDPSRVRPVSAEAVSVAQDLPRKFLDPIFRELRDAGLVTSVRGPSGGYLLARPASAIRLGDVFRAVGGPLAAVNGMRPHATVYVDPAAHLTDVWVAVRAAVRSVLDEVTLADVFSDDLPAHVRELGALPDAWEDRM